jgi:hypothetical protein
LLPEVVVATTVTPTRTRRSVAPSTIQWIVIWRRLAQTAGSVPTAAGR